MLHKCESWLTVFLLTKPVGQTSEPVESTILRVYEKLRQSLDEFAGSAAFHSLASAL